MGKIKCNEDGTFKSSADKFLTPDDLAAMAAAVEAQKGDLILILAGARNRMRTALGSLRIEMGNRLGLRDPKVFAPLWVVDFPLLEWDEETSRFYAMHHPFTAPKPEHMEWFYSDRTTSCSTAPRWAAAPSVSTIPKCRSVCSRSSVSAVRMRITASAS